MCPYAFASQTLKDLNFLGDLLSLIRIIKIDYFVYLVIPKVQNKNKEKASEEHLHV